MTTLCEITYHEKNGAELPRAEVVVVSMSSRGTRVTARLVFHCAEREVLRDQAIAWAKSFSDGRADEYEAIGEEKRNWLDPERPWKRNIEVHCCGEWISCNAFTVTCDDCGADYNMSGDRLAPRDDDPDGARSEAKWQARMAGDLDA